MYIESGIKVTFPVDDDQGTHEKDIVITDEISATEILDTIRVSKGKISEYFLRAWKEENLYILKVVDAYGSTIDYCGYVILQPKQLITIFPHYKKILNIDTVIKQIHCEETEILYQDRQENVILVN
jgi:hypothetical protein